MRRLVLLALLAGPAAADDPAVLHEERTWVGVIEATSVSREPADGRGRETQREKVTFRLVTRPPKTTIGWARLPMVMREGEGEWELALDVVEGSGEKAVVQKGSGDGRLWPRAEGWVEPGTGRYKLLLRCTPGALTARTTMSGLWEGRFTTWRTVAERRPFLLSLDLDGEAAEDGRVLAGEKRFLDRREAHPRDVVLTWRVERVDPVLRGRVVDQHGRPLAGIAVDAAATDPVRRRRGLPPLRREGASGGDGRFALEAFWAPWVVRTAGVVRDGVVYESARAGVDLKADDAPELALEVKTYRLDALPRPDLLVRHFQGDVTAYFEYMRARVPERRLAEALLPAE